MEIRASEISSILKEQIKNFGQEAEVSEIGQVLSVGDGIARVYGLDNVQAGEMVEFPNGVRGMALNLEVDNVGIVIFGEDREIGKATSSSGRAPSSKPPLAAGFWAAWSTPWAIPSTARARSSATSAAAST